MTLYRFPSGKLVSDEDYRSTFEQEYPSDRPEASPDYVAPSKDGDKQAVFEDSDEEEED
ncbi:hypothetical protein PED39_03020 [Methanomassiliicoccales archaeon LGM-RCC1]|nr:hypothetical protein PED39_03020 [Methanomassiliicoccales archaeon LGM-RCC1]